MSAVCPAASPRCPCRLLRRLLPNASRDEETLAAVSANVSANLLGLGNAATPLGIQAAGGWPETAAALPVTSCACWWCSTPPPSSFCPPPWPPSGLPSACRPLRHSARRLDQFSRLCHGGPAHRPPSLPPERRPCMNPSDLIIPLLLAGAAACGTGRRVNVYAALTRGRGGRSHRPAPRNPRSGGPYSPPSVCSGPPVPWMRWPGCAPRF